MKNKKIIFLVCGIAATLSLSAICCFNNKVEPVNAVQHEGAYSTYYYEGDYYNSISDSLTGGLNGTLKKALSTLALPKDWYTYSGSSAGTLGKILQDSDEDPTNGSNMVLFYTRDSISKRGSGGSTTDWNREHVWPQSLSNDHWGKEKGGADLLHIRPTWYATNNKRGSIRYGDNGKKGEIKYNDMPYAYTSGGYFEPLDTVKGDVARILMYVYTVYSEYYNDSSLVITKAIESYDVLLKWHTMDKPDALEGLRNNFAEKSNQKNRNPFVDHPEYAWKIFGDSASESVKEHCKQVYPEAETPIKLTKIELSGQLTKSEYIAGEYFDPTGLTVTATYSDNSSEVIPNDQCIWEPKRLPTGQTSVTCSYEGFTVTYNGIVVTAPPIPEIQGTYGIVFNKNWDETTTPIASNEVLTTYTAINTLVESVAQAENIYGGKNGLLFGAQGSIKFNLKEIAQTPNIESIYFVSKPYAIATEVDVNLNDEEISFDSSEGINLPIAGYFEEGILSITISSKRAFELVEFGINVKDNIDPDPDPQPSSSSSEPIISSSEEISSEPTPSSSKESPKNNTGCGGSIIAITSLTGISAVIGVVLIFSKRKEK